MLTALPATIPSHGCERARNRVLQRIDRCGVREYAPVVAAGSGQAASYAAMIPSRRPVRPPALSGRLPATARAAPPGCYHDAGRRAAAPVQPLTRSVRQTAFPLPQATGAETVRSRHCNIVATA